LAPNVGQICLPIGQKKKKKKKNKGKKKRKKKEKRNSCNLFLSPSFFFFFLFAMHRGVLFALLVLAVSSSVSGFGSLCGSNGGEDLKSTVTTAPTAVPVNYKVAFLGDAGYDTQQRAVLDMIKNWGAQVIIHSGG